MATAAEELRDRLDRMARLGARPKDYGLKVQSHSILLVTAQNKMRHASEHQVSFAGDGKIQTVFFQDRDINRANGRLTAEFLNALGPFPPEGFRVARPNGTQAASNGRQWTGVAGPTVADFLGALRFPEDTLDSQRLRDYIRAQLVIGELTDWTVILPSGRGSEQDFAGVRIRSVSRDVLKRNDADGELSYRTILSPGDEALDLSVDEFASALVYAGPVSEFKLLSLQHRESGGERPAHSVRQNTLAVTRKGWLSQAFRLYVDEFRRRG